MIPKAIKRTHIEAALDYVRRNGVPRVRQSRKFDLIVGDERFPPKYVVALAAELATGLRLDSDNFGGGFETNSFLRSLGFDVARKNDAPLLTSARSVRPNSIPADPRGKQVRVSRAWMNMGVSMSQFRAPKSADRWARHRKIVTGQAEADLAAYCERINVLLDASVKAGADVILMPACTLVHCRGMPLTNYRMPRACVVVSGALLVRGKETREHAVVAKGGTIVSDFFDGVNRVGCDKFAVYASISSTIKQLADEPEKMPNDLGHVPVSQPILLLDAGHHPYSDYYRRHTIRRAVDAIELRFGGPAAGVLASWQYYTTKPNPSWCWPEWRGKQARIIDGHDILDLLTIDLS